MTCKELAEKLMKTPNLDVVVYESQYYSCDMKVTSVYKDFTNNPECHGQVIVIR